MGSDDHRWINLINLGDQVLSEPSTDNQITLIQSALGSILSVENLSVVLDLPNDPIKQGQLEITVPDSEGFEDQNGFLEVAKSFLNQILIQKRHIREKDFLTNQILAAKSILQIDQKSTDPEILFSIIADIIKNSFDLLNCTIFLLNANKPQEYLRYSANGDESKSPSHKSQQPYKFDEIVKTCFQSGVNQINGSETNQNSDPSIQIFAAALPLRDRSSVFGVILLEGLEEQICPQCDQDGFAIFSPLISAIFQHEKLMNSALEQSWISNVMLQIADTAQRYRTLEDQLYEIARIMPLMIDIDKCAIFLRNMQNGEVIFESQFGFSDADVPKLAMFPFTRDGLLSMQEVTRGEKYFGLPGNLLEEDPESPKSNCCYLFPLNVHDQLYGFLLIDLSHDISGKDDGGVLWLDAIQSIGRQIALSIENHRLVEEKEIETYTTTVLLQSAEAIALAASISEALENICNLLPFFIGVDTTIIYLLSQQQRTYHLNAYQSSAWKTQSRNLPQQFREGHYRGLDDVLQEKTPALFKIEDIPPEDWLKINTKTIFQKQDDYQVDEPLLMVFPLHIQDEVSGFMLIRESEEALENRGKKVDILNGISRQISVAVQNVHLKEEIVDRERMRKEFQFAQEIQRTFLPNEDIEIPGYKAKTLWRPARQLGGDFFDIFPLPDQRFGIVIADVSDKGMPAALYMTVARTLIHAAAKNGASPEKTLSTVNQLLIENSSEGLFVTVIYGILSLKDGGFIYSNAGHNKPVLIQSKKVVWLEKGGMPLGITPHVKLDDFCCRLEPNDELIFYTDGVTECHSKTNGYFGEERLENIISANLRSKNPRSNMAIIDEKLLDFQGDEMPSDDVTILTIRRKAQTS